LPPWWFGSTLPGGWATSDWERGRRLVRDVVMIVVGVGVGVEVVVGAGPDRQELRGIVAPFEVLKQASAGGDAFLGRQNKIEQTRGWKMFEWEE